MEQQNTTPEPRPLPAFARNIRNPFILAALRGDNHFLVFKYIGGALIILGAFLMGQIPASLAIMAGAMMKGEKVTDLPDSALQSAYGLDKNLFLFLAILSFVIGILGIWVVVKFLHRRTFLSLVTPSAKLNWKKIGVAFAIYFVLSGAVEYIAYLQDPGNYALQFNVPRFVVLFLVTVLFMPFQTSFEELFFRGYLMQGFGLLFRSGIPAMVLTSVLFALMHGGNPEVGKFGFWTMFPFYCGFGLMLGFITLMDKSLEIPLAVHAANNMFGSLFITFEGSALQTDAVFMQKQMNPSEMMPFYFGSMFLFLLVCSFVFGWWKKKPEAPAEAARDFDNG